MPFSTTWRDRPNPRHSEVSTADPFGMSQRRPPRACGSCKGFEIGQPVGRAAGEGAACKVGAWPEGDVDDGRHCAESRRACAPPRSARPPPRAGASATLQLHDTVAVYCTIKRTATRVAAPTRRSGTTRLLNVPFRPSPAPVPPGSHRRYGIRSRHLTCSVGVRSPRRDRRFIRSGQSSSAAAAPAHVPAGSAPAERDRLKS